MGTNNFFMRMFDAKDPSVSSSRFLTVITVLSVLYTWMWLTIYLRKMVDIPTGVYAFVAIVVTGKTLGMFAEKSVTPPTPPIG